MDKETTIRTIVAIAISFVILFGSQYVFKSFYPEQPSAPAPEVIAPQSPTATESIQHFQTGTEMERQIISTPEQPLSVTMPRYNIDFNPVTGDVISVSLKNYSDKNDLAPTFMRTDAGSYAAFNAGITTGFTYSVDKSDEGTTVTFTASSDQITVTKQYVLGDSYYIPMTLKVENKTGTALSIPVSASIGPDLGKGFDENKYVFEGPIMRADGKTKNKAAAKVKETIVGASPMWGGYTSKYFLFSVFGTGFDTSSIIKYGNSAVVVLDKNLAVSANSSAQVENLAMYVGPKIYNDLKAFGIQLQKSIDFGMFFFLGIPMTKIMNFAYRYVHNYGIAIIILTIIVRLITLPLTLKSTMSMKAMSKVQPEMAALREKYKDEPEKMNAALMELYKTHKVNPLAGCLPLFIQLPIFFALYKSLLVSIELKGAPFFGWIVDLSMKDPFYITPILMGVTMFIQQKMTPSTLDPTQQKIMLMMPVVFTFIFLNFQSGLVVYWLTNNILSIVQQYVINKKTN